MYQGLKDGRSKTQKNVFLGFLFCAFVAFLALGSWQLYRLQWKRALIERIDQRVQATPIRAPEPVDWAGINAANNEYSHITVSGLFLYQYSVIVQASTVLGPGYWLLTPLKLTGGSVIYINRGFVKGAHPYIDFAKKGQPASAQVIGLLRMGEPKGGFLRANAPTQGRWYSRDVEAIASSQGISNVASFFIDAQVVEPGSRTPINPEGGEAPVMGLTVISFPNNHLVYALTWYALAFMLVIAFLRIKD